MSPSVVVVGGGLAGLTAALRLADRGFGVRLFEKRSILGGRAYSYVTPEAGHAVDNGQHVLMGCYRRTLALLERIGASSRIEAQPRMAVPLAHPVRGTSVFGCAALPAPLHLTAGALRYSHLTLQERARLLVGGVAFVARHRRGGWNGDTVAAALDRLGQGENLRACFWNPLAIAVLNEIPERASAALFAEVLRRVFFAPASASRIIFPRVGLSDLYAEPAARAIEAAGGVVETRRSARALVVSDRSVRRIDFHDGASVEASACVLAVPPPALETILPAAERSTPFCTAIERLHASPIVSVHLWFEEAFASPRMLGFLDGPIHWLFTPPMQPESGRYVTLVTSGAHELAQREPEEILRVARGALSRYVPETGDLALADSLVTKERAATFAATPDEQDHRPEARTSIANLFLAGDWTATGLPATIESAVESGERAADAVVEYLSSGVADCGARFRKGENGPLTPPSSRRGAP